MSVSGMTPRKPKLTAANAKTAQEKAIVAARAKNKPGPNKEAIKYEDGSTSYVTKSKGGRATDTNGVGGGVVSGKATARKQSGAKEKAPADPPAVGYGGTTGKYSMGVYDSTPPPATPVSGGLSFGSDGSGGGSGGGKRKKSISPVTDKRTVKQKLADAQARRN